MTLVFATRPSRLALWQTGWVIQRLQTIWPALDCRQEVITTQGDVILDRPLPEIGGKGLFTQELEEALLSGRIHAAVHSLKDLPVDDAPGLMIGAIPGREDVRDVLVSGRGYTLDTLPHGAVVGTSSLRRSAQLLAYRPDLQVQSLRGNVDTRVRKAQQGQYDAIVLAGAGVTRLGLESAITQWIPLSIMLPAPGQGALAVQCRADDQSTRGYLDAIENRLVRWAVSAERAFLAGLGGGCSLPVGAYATWNGSVIVLHGVAAAPDGSRLVRDVQVGTDPQQVGDALAGKLVAQGAGEFLHA